MLVKLDKVKNLWSRLTDSESQDQEEAACACPPNTSTGVLFTVTNVVKFPSSVTLSSWALLLSYYRASTFLPYRLNKPKMNKLSATIVKNQPFRLLWHLFPYLRLKLYHLESNSIVTRELIPLFYVESANQHSLHLCYAAFNTPSFDFKKSWAVIVFLLLFLQPLYISVIFKKGSG